MARILDTIDRMTEKQCSKCGQVKPVSEFYPRTNRPKNPYTSQCKSCMKPASRNRNRLKAESPEYLDWYYNRKYGITFDDYMELFNQQNGLCRLCGQPETCRNVAYRTQVRRLAVDHCKITGKIRGLLCMNCNTFLGFARENPSLLNRAIEYLEED